MLLQYELSYLAALLFIIYNFTLSQSQQLLKPSFHSVPQLATYGIDSLNVSVSQPHVIRHTHSVGLLRRSDQPVAKAATKTTRNKHTRWPTIRTAEFEPVIPEIERC